MAKLNKQSKFHSNEAEITPTLLTIEVYRVKPFAQMLSAFGGVFTLTFAALLNAHVDYSRAATTANKVAEDEGEYNYQNILKPVTAKISHFEEKSLLIDYCSRSGKAYQFCIDEWDTIIVYRINYASDSNLVDEFAAIYTAHLAELESEKATE